MLGDAFLNVKNVKSVNAELQHGKIENNIVCLAFEMISLDYVN